MPPASSLIPKGSNLYEILGVTREDATEKLIKSQYRKLALKFHPDKQSANATEDEKREATEAFQRLGLAYTILSDPAKKATYDRTGRIADDTFDDEKDWTAYFKELWTGVVNAETIEVQTAKYQGSEEEKEDVLKFYDRCKGNMDKILTFVECSKAKDGERFAEIIQEAIRAKKVPRYPAFARTTTAEAHRKRIEEEERREKQWDEQQKKRCQSSDNKEDSLQALIAARQKDRASRLDAVIDSIASKEKSKSKKRKHDELDGPDNLPSEEEFQRIQAELTKNKNKNKKTVK
ncbi:hypothetical protein VTP01DRAFT_2348 [Rhizomucor pusillus]|uniref:uncharacterized protein n=1 Tax=Rhizomucor pusillus TaxID=4840 RepID=UPI003742A221